MFDTSFVPIFYFGLCILVLGFLLGWYGHKWRTMLGEQEEQEQEFSEPTTQPMQSFHNERARRLLEWE